MLSAEIVRKVICDMTGRLLESFWVMNFAILLEHDAGNLLGHVVRGIGSHKLGLTCWSLQGSELRELRLMSSVGFW